MLAHVAELALRHGLLDSEAEAARTGFAELERLLFAEDAQALLEQAQVQDEVSLHALVALGRLPAGGGVGFLLPTRERPNTPSVLRQALAQGRLQAGEVPRLVAENRWYRCATCAAGFPARGALLFPPSVRCPRCGARAGLESASGSAATPGGPLILGEARDPETLVGERVGRWLLQSILGTGGWGAVYQAADEARSEQAAVKLVLPAIAETREYLPRFRQEAEATRRLDHPGVVGFRDYAEEPIPHLALELVDGTTLAAYLADRGRLPVDEVIQTGRAILEALAHAHRRGVIHRDLKPSNVLLRRDGSPVLADFGLGRVTGERASGGLRLTITGKALGTLHYMAPEQIQDSKRVDAACDLYALGAILFHLLSGRPPFLGAKVLLMLEQVRREPPDLRRQVPEAPPALTELVRALLAKEPAVRPSAVAALEILARAETELRARGAWSPRPAAARVEETILTRRLYPALKPPSWVEGPEGV